MARKWMKRGRGVGGDEKREKERTGGGKDDVI